MNGTVQAVMTSLKSRQVNQAKITCFRLVYNTRIVSQNSYGEHSSNTSFSVECGPKF